MDKDLKRIAARVRTWRNEARLTLQQLGDRSGVSASTIYKIENLQTVPTIAVLLKLARGLGHKPSEPRAEVEVEDRGIEVMIGNETYEIARGDSMHFDPNLPHRRLAAGGKPATVIVTAILPERIHADFATRIARAVEGRAEGDGLNAQA